MRYRRVGLSESDCHDGSDLMTCSARDACLSVRSCPFNSFLCSQQNRSRQLALTKVHLVPDSLARSERKKALTAGNSFFIIEYTSPRRLIPRNESLT